ncbi:MAG: hypothetical protein QGH37_07045 [Candidatus Poribacteria bacterium]|jgi:hypothetical protein|nr:hypothetical protein [Candidatus Poribacteria bacterium]MDP6961333.1 hypothetical protein [Dehalococcoidia bacterium]
MNPRLFKISYLASNSTISYTEKEALEQGKVTPHWLDSLKMCRRGVIPPAMEVESAIYYPAHLIKIDYEEVERIFAGGEARLSPW